MSKQLVIVGGSKGIGLKIVQEALQRGDRPIVYSRSSETLDGLMGIEHHEWDASSDNFPTETLPDQIDGLVYCPGSLNLRSFKMLKPETFREDFEVNVIGAVKAIQASLKGLKASASGSVVLFSTVAVGQGMFAHASIAASKGAIEGMARTLAAELAPAIRVNCIAPALTDTDMTQKFFATPEKAAAMGEKYPLGRAGTVDDMAATTLFLLDESSSWITGQVIGVDGGMSTLRK